MLLLVTILLGVAFAHRINTLSVQKALESLLQESQQESQKVSPNKKVSLEQTYLEMLDTSNVTCVNDVLRRNKKFVKKALQEDPEFFEHASAPQHPEILILSCSDSRISPEVVTMTNPGQLFVHRNIANLANVNDANFLSVLQYSVEALKVKHVVVMGHYGCGGVQASMSSKDHGSSIESWINSIRDTRRMYSEELSEHPVKSEEYFRRLVELNVQEQVFNIRKTRIVQKALKSGQPLSFHGWVYDMKTGLINKLKLDKKVWRSISKVYSLSF